MDYLILAHFGPTLAHCAAAGIKVGNYYIGGSISMGNFSR